MFFGNWSEMRDVRGAIGCEKTNFVGGDSTGTDKYYQRCMCYPSSNFYSFLTEILRMEICLLISF